MKKPIAILTAVFAASTALAQLKAPPNSVKVTASSAKTKPAPPPDITKARRITRDEAIQMVKANKAVYVDVRSRDSYDAEHIKGALNIPRSEILNRIGEVPPGKFIITYCA